MAPSCVTRTTARLAVVSSRSVPDAAASTPGDAAGHGQRGAVGAHVLDGCPLTDAGLVEQDVDDVTAGRVQPEHASRGGFVAPGVRGDDEVYPNAKRLAAVVAQPLATYPQGSSPDGVSRAVARKFETSPDRLLGAARELVRGEFQSAGTVVYPQLGG